MKKNSFIVLLAFFLVDSAAARIIGKVKTDDGNIHLLGTTDSAFCVTGYNHGLWIRMYDNNLIQKSAVVLKKVYPETSKQVWANSKVIVTNEDVSGTKKIFSIQHIVSPGGAVNSQGVEIFNIDGWKEHFRLESEVYEFLSRVSTSGRRLLFAYKNNFKEESGNEIKIRTLNSNDSLSEAKSLKIPYSSSLCKISGLLYDDSDGNKVKALVTVFDNPALKKRKVVKTELLEFDLDKNPVASSTVEIPVRSDYTASKMIFKNGKLIMSFLKSDPEAKGLTGIRFIIFGKQIDLAADVDFKDTLSIKKNILGNGDMYKLKDVQLLDDRKIIAVLEKNYSEESGAPPLTTMNAGGMMTSTGGGRTYFTSGDLFVAQYDILSKNGYMTTIKKDQSFENKSYLSYLLLVGDKSANLAFADKDENRSNIFSMEYKMSYYEISDSVRQQPLSRLMENDFTEPLLQTESSLRMNDGSFIIAVTQKKKETYLVKLKLSESENQKQ